MSFGIVSRAFRIANFTNSSVTNLATRNVEFFRKYQYFSSKPITQTLEDPVTGEVKKKKSPIIPKITLIQGNNLTVTTLEEAQKLSKRRDLRLVKMLDLDTKTERPVYKLMTGAEYHAEDIKQRELKKAEKEKNKNALKGEKLVILSQNITEHDMGTNVKRILKWLTKPYEVRIIINGDSNNMSKAVSLKPIVVNG